MKRWKKGVLIGLFSSLLFDQQAVEAAVGVANPNAGPNTQLTPPLAVTYPIHNRMRSISREYRLKVPTQVALVSDLQSLDNANEVNHAPPVEAKETGVESEHLMLAEEKEEANPVMSSVLHPVLLASRGELPTAADNGPAQSVGPNQANTSAQAEAAPDGATPGESQESSTQQQTSSIQSTSNQAIPTQPSSSPSGTNPPIQSQPIQNQPTKRTSNSISNSSSNSSNSSSKNSTSNSAPTLMSQAGVTVTLGARLVAIAKQYLGDPYCYGGTTPSGFDCSGFTQYVFRQAGISLPRTTYAQINAGPRVSRQNLQPGDLLFFSCNGQPTSHSGIYIGNGQFIHADQTRGIAIADLSNPYWAQVYQTAVRVQ